MFIQDRASDLVQEPSIDSEAFFRLQKYPAQIRSSVHHATVTIPRRLAYILHQDPAYISPAVEAFYLRDPIALRPLQTRRSSTLFFIPEDFVTVTVRFSRVGYAQLKGQDFPKPPAWVGGSAKGIGTHGPTQREMGMKVTCGFEMLLSDPQNVDKKSVREIKLLLEDVDAREEQLPSDDDIARWESIQDDESWLEIDFNDFETELSGRGGQIPLRQGAGFGDRTAQDNLRKMVARFEKFLHDEDETGEDAEFLDDMDYDDDSDTADGTTTPNSKSKDGESEVDFDEGRFASMIRDMMGIAPSTTPDTASNRGMPADRGAIVEEDDESLEESEMRRVMDEMETELTQAGALSLEPSSIDKSYSKKDSASSRIPSSGVPIKSTPSQSSKMSATEDFAEDGGEVSIDPDPAKELLRHLTKG